MKNDSLWHDKVLEREEYSFLPLDNIGTPTFFKVKNWENYEELTFFNEQGNAFTRNYLHTSEGLLALSSKRLLRQLKPFAMKHFKGQLTIQRWCEGSDTRSTVFKIEKSKPVTVATKLAPAKKRVVSKSKKKITGKNLEDLE
ncbi:hypothetical protein ES703_90151 [subsurface metagenome]